MPHSLRASLPSLTTRLSADVVVGGGMVLPGLVCTPWMINQTSAATTMAATVAVSQARRDRARRDERSHSRSFSSSGSNLLEDTAHLGELDRKTSPNHSVRTTLSASLFVG